MYDTVNFTFVNLHDYTHNLQMYSSLKDEIPNFSNDRVRNVNNFQNKIFCLQASRAQILKKAIETIQTSNTEMRELTEEIEKLEEMNRELRKKIEGSETKGNKNQISSANNK